MKYLISIYRILTAKKWVVVTLEKLDNDDWAMQIVNHNITTKNMVAIGAELREFACEHAAQCSAVDEVNEILKSK